jgi:hypothetical protein
MQAISQNDILKNGVRSLRCALFTLLLATICCSCFGQDGALASLIAPHDYVQKRVSSYDKSGGNADAIRVAAGSTATLLDATGPGIITHIWFTIASPEELHLKKIVLRMYWDDETTPSVETPIGDFFGLGLGEYYLYQSTPLAVAPDKALNSFFEMPFRKKARITVTNEGNDAVDAFYFNIDYRAYDHPLPADTLYFHAEYQAQHWRACRQRQEAPQWGRQLCVDDGEGPGSLCRRDHVSPAESEWLVWGGRRYVLYRWRDDALDQRNGYGGLLPWRLGLWQSPLCLRHVWCSCKRS